ncbi:MAG: 50S ribosomal protein L25 [Thermotogae bacterium]|nr:50S ribosomal protein L25 [Thermotogota bacterium]
MEHVLRVQRREKLGTNAAKRYRKEGYIPVVFYGKGEGNIHALVRRTELLKFLHEIHGESVVVSVFVEGEEQPRMAIVKDIQLHPVSDDVIHVDFQLLHKGEEIEIEVPVVLKNVENAPATRAGGVIELLTHTLAVKSKPQHIPAHIEIDASDLELGDVVHVRDIKTENFIIAEDPDMPVVTVLKERGGVEVGPTEEEAASETTEGTPES